MHPLPDPGLHAPAYTPDTPLLALRDFIADPVAPARFPQHVLRFRNDRAARTVGLAEIDDDAWIEHFARFAPLAGNLETPLALRYHGHQFRAWNPQLGDGRGFLYAQLRDDRGRLLDLGTKGSGRTPWSRGGDGRLTLKGGVREILATEMLEALGVPTSRTFSVVETGEQLLRGDEPSPTRSCVLVRLNHSHIRFGTFQRLAWHGQVEETERLLRYCARWYPDDAVDPDADAGPLALAFLDVVARRLATTCARWMTAGFVHGVLNTDNMNITGESFDYGPWRFLPRFDPTLIAAYFDHGGLYRYDRQPTACLWNLERLAECMAPFVSPEAAEEAVSGFADAFLDAQVRATLDRLGLATLGADEDATTARAVWAFLDASRPPFEAFWYDHLCWPTDPSRADRSPRAPLWRGLAWERMTARLRAHAVVRPERVVHPRFNDPEPTTCVIDEVERVWAAIDERDDWGPLYRHVEAIRTWGEALAG